jgi:BirA family biotin operon repressor/biotin-[acetyl-CoA-carboxylase] ligase
MKSNSLFHILGVTDSTNNYAMGQVYAGLAKHGMVWFAREQTSGKGQRGNTWLSKPGKNIIMSISLQPPAHFLNQPFLFNALISNTSRQFLDEYIPGEVKVKWPNDLYIRDRKAGGVLIENNYQGKAWNWSVAGIGINVNQESFPGEIRNPVSIHQVTGKEYDVLTLGRRLHHLILEAVDASTTESLPKVLEEYNSHLFRLGESVKLRKRNIVFETRIEGVDARGQLITSDNLTREFSFGEVEWVM